VHEAKKVVAGEKGGKGEKREEGWLRDGQAAAAS